jgi:hypothetical protein
MGYPGAPPPPGWFYPPPAGPDWLDPGGGVGGGLYTPDMGREERIGSGHNHHHHHHHHHQQQHQQQQQQRDPRKRSRSKSQQKEAAGRKKRKGPTDSDIERTYTGNSTLRAACVQMMVGPVEPTALHMIVWAAFPSRGHKETSSTLADQ